MRIYTPSAGGVAAGVLGGTYPNPTFAVDIAYVEFTSNVTIASTSEASPTSIVTSGAIVYTATPIIIEFYSPEILTSSTLGSTLNINLWDGGANLGRCATIDNLVTASQQGDPCYCYRKLT